MGFRIACHSFADMAEDWLGRWREGRIGWHEPEGNAALKKHWPPMAGESRVFVPLCGKTPDLMWLANEGYDVTGIELSPIACESFFEEQGINFAEQSHGKLPCYEAMSIPLRIFCGDFFEFRDEPFDAVYDRGSLVTFPADEREGYVAHMRTLLRENSTQLLLTLEYDQSAVDGPPWSVMPDEVHRLWPELHWVGARNDIDNSPPKFRNAGLTRFMEVVWSTS